MSSVEPASTTARSPSGRWRREDWIQANVSAPLSSAKTNPELLVTHEGGEKNEGKFNKD